MIDVINDDKVNLTANNDVIRRNDEMLIRMKEDHYYYT